MRLRLCTVIIILFIGLTLAADDGTLNYSAFTLETFDDPEARTWIVRGSQFSETNFPRMKYVEAWPAALFGNNPDDLDLKSLGIHARFRSKGYNYIEILPVTVDETGKTVVEPITIPGRVKYLSMWVWCSNFNFYLEAHIRDYKGMEYVLNLGSLREEGWKNLSVTIPSTVPQMGVHLPKYKTVKLTRLVLWTRPQEDVDNFFIYLDHIFVLTDLYQERFDGDILSEERQQIQIWGPGAVLPETE